MVHGRAGTGGGARPHVLALRALPGREGCRHGGGDVPGPRASRNRDLAPHLDSRPVALRLRVGRVPDGGRVVPAVGPAHGPRPGLHLLGERGPGVADHLCASRQRSAAERGDGAPVPDAQGRGRVTRVAVVGGGAWGTALADLLARKGDVDAVTLWAREAEVVVSAAPSHAVRDVMTQARGHMGRGALVVSVSKGLDPERLTTPSCVLADALPKDTLIAVLSGPSFSVSLGSASASTQDGVVRRSGSRPLDTL